MKDDNFPVYFSLILTNGFKIENLSNHGYKDYYTFFQGTPPKTENSQNLDWSGNNSNIVGKFLISWNPEAIGVPCLS